MSIAALPPGDEGYLAYRVHDFAYVHGLKQRLCTSLSTATNIGNSLHSILPAQCPSSYDHNPTKNADTWTRPLKSWTQSLSLGATMSNHSIHDMRRPRRNTVSEIPFAGRIGGFQQEIADDEKNREILKSQPDAVCPFRKMPHDCEKGSRLTKQDSPLLNPRRTSSLRLSSPR